MSYKPCRLLHVDDSPVVRSGVAAMLRDEEHITIVGEASDGTQATEKIRALRPDLVLMDVRMPKQDGLTTTRQLKIEHPSVPVLIFTSHEQDDYILKAIRNGAAGYLLKDATPEEIIEKIEDVLSGNYGVEPALAQRCLKRLARDHAFSQAPSHDAAPPPHQPDIYRKPVLSPLIDTLSPQERETLSQIAEGKTNSQIGESMRLSPHTIKTYVENILRKLKVSDRTQASVAALQLGLIPESALRN